MTRFTAIMALLCFSAIAFAEDKLVIYDSKGKDDAVKQISFEKAKTGGNIAVIDLVKQKKTRWDAYSILKASVYTESDLGTIKFRIVRRALDDGTIQQENPKYDKEIKLKKGNNDITFNIEGAGGSESRLILVEKIEIAFSSKENDFQKNILSIVLEKTEEE